MQWTVTYRQEHINCCPPGRGWIVKKCTITADTVEHARTEFFRIWPPRHKIEIKSIELYT
jgi:hypothetical protein